MSVRPVFILSLPRAGSTLLQRLLSQHDAVSTSPEPWLALPFFYSLRPEGVRSIYGHKTLANAVNGFVDSLPAQKKDYMTAAASFLTEMYTLSSDPGSLYFLDKTPRYHLIIDDLMTAFPDAKFIFLWRNPLAVAASMIKTWGKGDWNLYMFWVDLYRGLDSLVSSYNNNSDRSIAVRYEDLVASPDDEMQKVMSYLNLDYRPEIVSEFNQAKIIDAPGRGDPTGQYEYKEVSKGSVDRWLETLANPFRKKWSQNYLEWIGEERLNTMGYSFEELNTKIKTQRNRYGDYFSDIIRNAYGKVYCKYSLEDIRSNKPLTDNIYICRN